MESRVTSLKQTPPRKERLSAPELAAFEMFDMSEAEHDIRLGKVLWKIWCKYCKQMHAHPPFEGHHEARCIPELNTPYSKTGYVLKYCGILDSEKEKCEIKHKQELRAPEGTEWFRSNRVSRQHFDDQLKLGVRLEEGTGSYGPSLLWSLITSEAGCPSVTDVDFQNERHVTDYVSEITLRLSGKNTVAQFIQVQEMGLKHLKKLTGFTPRPGVEIGPDAPAVLCCPVCGYECNHFDRPYFDSSIAGDRMTLPLQCENGHEYSLSFQQYKGAIEIEFGGKAAEGLEYNDKGSTLNGVRDSFNDMDAFWDRMLRELERRHLPTFRLVSEQCYLLSVIDHELVIGAPNETLQKSLEQKAHQVKAACAAIGRDLQVKVRVARKELAPAASAPRQAPITFSPEESEGIMTALGGSMPFEFCDVKILQSRKADWLSPNVKALVDVEVDGMTFRDLRLIHEPKKRPWVSMPVIEWEKNDGKKGTKTLITLPKGMKKKIDEAVFAFHDEAVL
jgi:hypothetical protein